MKEKAMILASFAADSLALGVHWIYDTRLIDTTFGRVERFIKPGEASFHPTKDRGDFTHYGDQTLILLQSLSASSDFDLNDFAERWRNLFQGYAGYKDHATRSTLDNFAKGQAPSASGSPSSDLGGASRIAPLVYRYRDDLAQLLSAARAQTAMTHNHPEVIRGAEFLAEVTWHVLHGKAPVDAIQSALDSSFREGPLRQWVVQGMESAAMGTRRAIAALGQMCDIEAALPAAIHLMVKYPDDLKTALVENVMAGGDSAARGLVVGMVLGAHLGQDAIPDRWLSEMKRYPQIVELLKAVDQARTPAA